MDASADVDTVDLDSFCGMRLAWDDLNQRQAVEVRDYLVDAAVAMAAVRSDLLEAGAWVTGPSSLMAVLGVGRAEVIKARHVRLEQPEAEGVDCADEEPVQPVQGRSSESFLDPNGDALLQLGGGAFGEREGHDALGGDAIGEEIYDPLRYDFGLAGTG